MNALLWIAQVVLGVLFALSGLVKATQPMEKLIARYPWMGDVSAGLIRFIGVVEILGGIGLIVPRATAIAPVLTPLAATGLAVLTGLGLVMHLRRREPEGVRITAVLFVLTALLAGALF